MNDPLTLGVAALASYRLARLGAVDDITASLRDRTGAGWFHETVSCPFCLGLWLSAAVYVTVEAALGAWHGLPLVVHGARLMAVAGVQALLSATDDRLVR